MWPDEFNFLLDGAEEVTLDIPAIPGLAGSAGMATQRQALRVRLSQQDYERIWPLAETRYRLGGKFSNKAITLIVNNPHYHQWHPADGGATGEAGDPADYRSKHVLVHFLLDDVRETVAG
jgi:hypothetical protein